MLKISKKMGVHISTNKTTITIRAPVGANKCDTLRPLSNQKLRQKLYPSSQSSQLFFPLFNSDFFNMWSEPFSQRQDVTLL